MIVITMTGDDIINAILSSDRVFLHYTDAMGLAAILQTGVIRTNQKFVVYLTQEPTSPSDAHTNLFIGATTHEGRGSHILVLRIDSGVLVDRVAYLEYVARQSLRLDQHSVLYAGPNPF